MKSILFVSNSGDIIGGGEISFYQLVKHLDSSSFQRFVVCPDKGKLYSQMEGLGICVDILKMPSLRGLGPSSLPVCVWKFLSLAKRWNVQLIHANGSRCMIYAGLAGRLAKVPVVWHVRVMDKDRLLDRFLAMLSTRIIVNSKAVSQRFSFLSSGSDKLSVVYNGVDLNEFDARYTGDKIKKEYKIGKTERVVAIVGRLDEWKGHHVFLKAARKVLDRSNQVKFLVVGDGVMRNELETLSMKLGITRNIMFCGQRNDIPQILAASDMLVSASFAEHFGRVVIEAMAMKKPVVATKAGGVPEIVIDGETGILVKPADPEGLASAILSLLENPQGSKEMGAAGRERVIEHFSIEKHVRDVEKIYESLSMSSEPQGAIPGRSCNLCGARSTVLLQQAEEPYRVVRCEQCTLVYVDPLPGQRVLEGHYDESYYHEWISTQKREREILWINRLAELRRYKKKGRLLDIGVGDGTFIRLAKEAGFEVFGTELSRYAGRRARELYEVPVFVGNVIEAGFEAEYFDVVTLYHVIEHVDDPRRYLSEAYRILKSDGLLIVACPNLESYVFNLAYRCFQRRPVKLFSQHDKEIHLYHFSSQTLAMLLEMSGFTLISIGPDDFPVDLRKRVVEWLARGLYQVTRRNWTMGLKALAVKATCEELTQEDIGRANRN